MASMTATEAPPQIVADTAAIRALRYELGLNIAQFAKLANVDVGQMSRIENGKIPGSPAALKKIAIAGKTTVAAITKQIRPEQDAAA